MFEVNHVTDMVLFLYKRTNEVLCECVEVIL